MRDNKVPIDFFAEQRVQMLISSRLAGTIEDRVADAAHARHELDAEEPTQAEYGFVLALRIGMERVRLNLGLVLHQRVQDMDRFPDTAGNEAGEQRDIAIGDVVVGDAAVAAISNMPRTHEIVFA